MYNTAKHSLTRALAGSILLLSILLLVCPDARATYRGKNGRVVFVSNIGGTNQLYTMNPDGSDMVQITNLPPTDNGVWAPDFSPDGSRIVFSHDQTGHLELYVVNADGTGLVQLTNDGLDNLFAHWSPDGSWLVFAHTDPELGTGRIATMRSDGTGALTILTSEIPWDCYQPEFSPDGKQIVFASQSGGLISALWIMRADGRQKRRLTAAALEAGGPDYSPDGQNVAFYSQQNTALPSSVYAMRPDGSNLRLLAGKVALYPTYSPDGKKILFSGGPTLDQAINLYTMNADGTNRTQVGSNLVIGGCDIGNCLFPDWGASPE